MKRALTVVRLSILLGLWLAVPAAVLAENESGMPERNVSGAAALLTGAGGLAVISATLGASSAKRRQPPKEPQRPDPTTAYNPGGIKTGGGPGASDF